MIRSFVTAIAISCAAGAACKKETAKPAEQAAQAAQPAPTAVGNDGLRHIAVEATKDGYKPDKIAGKPGEKLLLAFTRTADSSCIAQLKTPDGKLVDLPMNTAVDVAVTVPNTGEIGFACGMDMFHGTIVAQP